MSARVFISCGQSKDTDEVEVAHRISERLREEGFEPYVAVEEQTLLGLTENIFARLRSSEYFVFIDFKRERLADTNLCRGSLFSHQELAIAAFLNIDAIIAFQEIGVKSNDGMLRFLQANAIQFTDRNTLPNLVADFVRQRHWNENWRNELSLEREPNEFTDALINLPQPQMGVNARFFHIKVHNRHKSKLATNCTVYLERAVRLPDIEISLKTVEFKWAGVLIPSVGIAPGGMREFDAFHLLHPNPTSVQFNVFADSTSYFPVLPRQAGEYKLSYVVISENFPPTRGTFMLRLSNQLASTTFS